MKRLSSSSTCILIVGLCVVFVMPVSRSLAGETAVAISTTPHDENVIPKISTEPAKKKKAPKKSAKKAEEPVMKLSNDDLPKRPIYMNAPAIAAPAVTPQAVPTGSAVIPGQVPATPNSNPVPVPPTPAQPPAPNAPGQPAPGNPAPPPSPVPPVVPPAAQ